MGHSAVGKLCVDLKPAAEAAELGLGLLEEECSVVKRFDASASWVVFWAKGECSVSLIERGHAGRDGSDEDGPRAAATREF